MYTFDTEETLRRRKLLGGYFKDKFRREEPISNINNIKTTIQWRELFRNTESKDLKADIKMLRQIFQAELNFKDEMIKLYDSEYEDLKVQFARAMGEHFLNLENLAAIQEKRIEIIRKQFKKQSEKTKEVIFEQEAFGEIDNKKDIEDIALINKVLTSEYETKERSDKATFCSRTEEIKEESNDDQRQMRAKLEVQIDEVLLKLKEEFRIYRDQMTERLKVYLILKQKDDASCSILSKQKNKINRTSKIIKHLKTKVTGKSHSFRGKNKILKEELAKVTEYSRMMIERVSQGNKDFQGVIGRMVSKSNNIKNRLEKQKQLGLKVLNLAECCRRLETEQEQILPFYREEFTEDELRVIQECEEIVLPNHFPEGTLKEYPALNNLWKRSSKVAVDTLAIEKENEIVAAENLYLRNRLKEYIPEKLIAMKMKEERENVRRNKSCFQLSQKKKAAARLAPCKVPQNQYRNRFSSSSYKGNFNAPKHSKKKNLHVSFFTEPLNDANKALKVIAAEPLKIPNNSEKVKESKATRSKAAVEYIPAIVPLPVENLCNF